MLGATNKVATSTKKRSTTIELNGNIYDARTGELLHSGGKTAPLTVPQASGQRSLDGVVKSKHLPTIAGTAVAAATKQITTSTAIPKPTVKKPVMDVSRPAPQHAKRRAPKKSQTLMRSAVSKPEPSLKRKAKATSNTTALVAQPKPQIVPKLAHPVVDRSRQTRAHHVPRSPQIRRYALDSALRPQPTPTPATRPATANVRPVYADTPAVHAVQTPMPTASSMDVFERALVRANSHKETYTEKPARAVKRKKSAGKRVLTASTASLAILLVVGFAAFQNQAQLTIKYASNKAGFTAELPSYKPAGYKVGKLSYNPGAVAVQYTNTASGQSFKLVQKESNWDSSALLDDHVSSRYSSYKTIEAAGRTIYTYGKNNASWVIGGVWYQLESDGNLTTEDVVNLASSI